MGKSQRDKGKYYERRARDVFRKHGWNAERGQQRRGSNDSPDVVVEALPLHIEVKGGEHPPIHPAYDQAVRDSNRGLRGRKPYLPLVMAKRKGRPWTFTLSEELFFALLQPHEGDPFDLWEALGLEDRYSEE